MFDDSEAAPPINNLLQPDIYNRLDAEAIERTRVVNSQLEQRLSSQQRILAKYRLAAERYHRREKSRVKAELSRITTKLPTVSRIRNFRSKFLYGQAFADPSGGGHDQQGHTTRGIPADKRDLPFCERFFIHHLPNKRKYYKVRSPTPLYLPLIGDEIHGPAFTEAIEESVAVVALPPLNGSDTDVEQPPVGLLEVADIAGSPALVDGTRPESGEDVFNAVDMLDLDKLTDRAPGSKRQRRSMDDARLRDVSHSAGQGRSLDEGAVTERVAKLPPLQRQNWRLSVSSPQLFHKT